MPYFDTLYAAADEQLDRVFAGLAWYRASGAESEIRASVRSHQIGMDKGASRETGSAAESWQGYVVECWCAQIVQPGTTIRVKPRAGEEFAFPLPDGRRRIYTVNVGPNGKEWEPLDTIDRKMLVFAKQDRDEEA
jgi:hypothetical protein